MEKFLTPDDVADRLQIKRHKVMSLINEAGLVAVKVGCKYRISPQDLDAWIASNTTGRTVAAPTRTPLVSSAKVLKFFGQSRRGGGSGRRRASRSVSSTSTDQHGPSDEKA